ncbi:MAG: hypothetical protein GX364_01420 [Firmicutes bacterium]|jgi:CO dehydrogenase/acetyl-CoA synthase beta subunit|nr:hypothetical protein [Bacillota bacterium]
MLFDEPFKNLTDYLADARLRGVLTENEFNIFSAWPEKRSLVLQEDMAVELGSANHSLFLIMWTTRAEMVKPNRISLVGQDLTETEAPDRLPFAQIVLVHGHFSDDYDTYKDIRDVVFDVKPEGISIRIRPDRQKIWCRVSSDALKKGFSLVRYGSTLIKKIVRNKNIKGCEVIFITESTGALKGLSSTSERVRDTLEALIRMYEEMNFDCDSCEYIDVCSEVAGLREIRDRLRKERGLS